MIEGFFMSPEMGEEFYKLCLERDIQTVEERTALLREFVTKKQALYIRDVAEFIDGKKVVAIKPKRKPK